MKFKLFDAKETPLHLALKFTHETHTSSKYSTPWRLKHGLRAGGFISVLPIRLLLSLLLLFRTDKRNRETVSRSPSFLSLSFLLGIINHFSSDLWPLTKKTCWNVRLITPRFITYSTFFFFLSSFSRKLSAVPAPGKFNYVARDGTVRCSS